MPNGKGKSGGRGMKNSKGRVKTGPPKDRRLTGNKPGAKYGK
jgi:hypothetical protein